MKPLTCFLIMTTIFGSLNAEGLPGYIDMTAGVPLVKSGKILFRRGGDNVPGIGLVHWHQMVYLRDRQVIYPMGSMRGIEAVFRTETIEKHLGVDDLKEIVIPSFCMLYKGGEGLIIDQGYLSQRSRDDPRLKPMMDSIGRFVPMPTAVIDGNKWRFEVCMIFERYGPSDIIRLELQGEVRPFQFLTLTEEIMRPSFPVEFSEPIPE